MDGFEILKNEKSLGVFTKEQATPKLKKLMAKGKWVSFLFPGSTLYKNGKKTVIEVKNVGCHDCAIKENR